MNTLKQCTYLVCQCEYPEHVTFHLDFDASKTFLKKLRLGQQQMGKV